MKRYLKKFQFISLCVFSLAGSILNLDAVEPTIKKGDRIALVGNTFIEREATDGHIETALTLAHPEANLVFRNLAWSGDTVFAESRGYFKPQEGYGLLLKEVVKEKPTLVILNYGANAAWKGKDGVKAFRQQYIKLIQDLKKKTGARIILMTPPAQESFPKPYPNPEKHNLELERYSKVIKDIASLEVAAVIDLNQNLKAPQGSFWTNNSVHFTKEGYQQAAKVIVEAFGKKVVNSEESDKVRGVIVKKNEQFFHRWRPQNTTYLFGFRKHEQGKNGVEVEQILPYVTKLDTEIQSAALAISKGQKTNIKAVVKPGVGFKPSEGKYVRPPEEELKTLIVPEDLEVSLFAAEPMLINPTNMNWDAQGRLWVASAPLYPHVKPGHKATDHIVVLEDTDGDGKADKSTVFAEDLLIPTGVLPGNGGVYVANSTELLFLKDTDGDGKADLREVVMSGFGTEDTHHILHTPRWGQDGLMYLNQSIYIHSHVETPWGVSRLMQGGIWQYEPLTGKFEVLSRGLINTWGHQMDDWGQSFATDGAGGDGINYIFPDVAGRASYGTNHILRGMNPGQPKICGLEILSGTHLPEKYRGLLVGNDFRGHRTNVYQLSENGSGYVSKQQTDLIGTPHRGLDRLGKGGAFRPIDIKMGPDGAVYIADWSNIIIQHGEVDFRDDRRDHEHGRIWRISAKGKPALKAPKIVGAKAEDLIKNLESSERWVVDMSKRELIERGPSVLPAVKKWEKSLKGVKADELRLHAMWLHVGLDQVETEILERCLQSSNGKVRAAALRTVYQWAEQLPQAYDYFAKAAVDEHSRVRLEALHGLRKLNTTAAAEASVKVLDKEMDKFLDYALILNMRNLQPVWAGKTSFEGNIKYISYAIKATGNRSPIGTLFAELQAGKVPAESKENVLMLIAKLGDKPQLETLYQLAVGKSLTADVKSKVFNALSEGVTQRKVYPNINRNQLANLIQQKQGAVSIAAAHLAGSMRVGEALGALKHLALTSSKQDAIVALNSISQIGGGGAIEMLKNIIAQAKPDVKTEALAGLVRLKPDLGAVEAMKVFKGAPADMDATPVFNAFYRIKNGPNVLSKHLKPKSLPKHIAQAGVRAATTAGRNLTAHIQQLSAAGDLKPMKQNLSPAEMKAIVEQVKTQGNPKAGEAIYRRQALACVVCHAIGGAGSPIGPDLISIGASAPIDYIVESLLNPNAKIKEGYHMTVATMKDGRSIAGSQVSDAGGKLVIRDAAGILHTFNSKEVKSKIINPTSMMPPGLTASLQPEEFVHLVAFLSKLGTGGEYNTPKGHYVRSLEVSKPDEAMLAGIKKKGLRHIANNIKKVQWNKGYSLVNGKIPLDDETMFATNHKFMRFKVEVSQAGEIDIVVSHNKDVFGWIGGRFSFHNGYRRINLNKGVHDVYVYIGPKHGKSDITIQLREVHGSKAVSALKY